MNQKEANSKMCFIDLEINWLSKLLFAFMVFLSTGLTVFNGRSGIKILYFCRCVLLLSSIIPISLRANLDQAKIYYTYLINHDEDIKGSIVRNSVICEDLGRLSYLITDKTGTLT
jgi:phospholipid-translocating ATPase